MQYSTGIIGWNFDRNTNRATLWIFRAKFAYNFPRTPNTLCRGGLVETRAAVGVSRTTFTNVVMFTKDWLNSFVETS